MITTRLYLDTRASGPGRPAPIKVSITKRSETAYLPTGVKVLPEQWDKANQRIIKHPDAKTLNNFLTRFRLAVDDQVRDMVLSGRAATMPITDVKKEVAAAFEGAPATLSFDDYFRAFLVGKSDSTKEVYAGRIACVYSFDEDLASRSLSSVSQSWVNRLDKWLQENYSGNTRKQTMAILQTLFKKAEAERLVSSNPFRDVRIPYVATRKRNLSQAQFRRFWHAEPLSPREALALDLFRFSFLAIAMNSVDIASLTPGSIFNGRIEYDRAKTGKHYSVKIVPELQALIDQYSGSGLLFSPFASQADYSYLVSNCDKLLTRIAKRLGLPPVTPYWARHSWASLAAELDIPIDVISSALGHSHGAKVTMVYINQDQRKVDEANRRVIDFALYDDIKE